MYTVNGTDFTTDELDTIARMCVGMNCLWIKPIDKQTLKSGILAKIISKMGKEKAQDAWRVFEKTDPDTKFSYLAQMCRILCERDAMGQLFDVKEGLPDIVFKTAAECLALIHKFHQCST